MAFKMKSSPGGPMKRNFPGVFNKNAAFKDTGHMEVESRHSHIGDFGKVEDKVSEIKEILPTGAKEEHSDVKPVPGQTGIRKFLDIEQVRPDVEQKKP